MPARITEIEQPRRIVSGIRDGVSLLSRVETVDEIDYALTSPPAPPPPKGAQPAPDYSGHSTRFFRIWGSDRLPVRLPTDARAPLFDFGPTPEETPEALRRSATCPPPLGFRIGYSRSSADMVRPPSRMHFTETIDLVFIMSGRQGELLQDAEMMLRAGDLLVQNGTVHSHEALGGEPLVIGWVILGALSEWTPPIELLHGVSGPHGGWRPGETRDKKPMAPWIGPAPAPGRYPDLELAQVPIEEVARPRRVVTGTNAAGRSHYALIEAVDEVERSALGRSAAAQDGYQTFHLWHGRHLPGVLPMTGENLPDAPDGAPPMVQDSLRRLRPLPAPLGYCATITRIAPGTARGPFRWHSSVDIVFVMAGELNYLLDGGDQVAVGPGDVIVQHGANHAWENTGTGTAVLGTASLGAAWLGPRPPADAAGF